MSSVTLIDPTLLSIAAELPRSEYTTEELIAAGRSHLSDQLVTMVSGLDYKHMLDGGHTYDGHFSFPSMFTA